MMLYIMRHGKTDWNTVKRLQGRTDIPLNEEGRSMAQQARKVYRDVHFDICYCSPLLRAKETAEILLEGREIEIILDDRLMEMSFGDYEGQQVDFEDTASPLYTLFKHPEQYKGAPNGESFADLFARTGAFLKEVVEPQLSQGKDVLIVGHGAMNCSIVCQRRGMELSQFWDAGIENCKLKEI